MEKKIIIPEENLNLIISLIKRLNNRKFMKDLNEKVELEIIRSFNDKYEALNENGNITECIISLTELKLSYNDRVFNNDLQILGEITVTDKEENIVTNYTNGLIDLEKFKNDKNTTCEHCGTNRKRKHLYIVKNGNELIKVGKSCLKDYLKIENISLYVKLIREIKEIENRSRIIKYDINDKIIAVELIQALEYIRDFINKNGYLSSKKAYELKNPNSCTKEKIKEALRNNKFEIEKMQNNEFEVNENLKNDIELLKDYFKNKNTEYAIRFYNILNNKYVNLKKDLGILSSFFATLEFLKKEIEKEKAAQKLEWLGEIKEKIETTVTFVKNKIYDGYVYGSLVYYYYFKDKNGNNIKWKTSKDLELEEGEKLIIKGSIKELDYLGEEKITVLTRCKIVK